MKCLRGLVAVPLLLAFAGAKAQSAVTLYGIADASIEHISNVKAASGVASMNRLMSGANNQSRWGLRVKEDLGDGLAAVVNLESGFNLDDGTQVSGLGFSRAAVVGLQGRIGTLLLGRQLTTINSEGPFDPMAYWRMGSKTLVRAANAFIRDNQVRFTSTPFGCLSVGAHGLVRESAAARPGYGVEVGCEVGPLLVKVIREVDRNPVTGLYDNLYAFPRQTFAGARYAIDSGTSVMLGYVRLDAPDDAVNGKSARHAWIGARALVAGHVILSGAVYRLDVATGARSTLFALGGEYVLSRRTSLYAMAGTVGNRGGGVAGVTPGDLSVANARQNGLDIGLIHKF